MGSHKGEGNQSPTPQVFTNEAVNGFTIFEVAKQRRKTVGLVVQGEHRLMHKRKSGMAGFSNAHPGKFNLEERSASSLSID
jgi:hypothetical protein